MTERARLLPGTLDLLILKAVSLGPLYGYGILLRIEQISQAVLLIEQGALYAVSSRAPGTSEGSLGHVGEQSPNEVLRRDLGRAETLHQEEEGWNRLVAAIASALKAQPEGT
jgi:PadR family transcriptional regulator, regulatory protein PadR